MLNVACPKTVDPEDSEVAIDLVQFAIFKKVWISLFLFDRKNQYLFSFRYWIKINVRKMQTRHPHMMMMKKSKKKIKKTKTVRWISIMFPPPSTPKRRYVLLFCTFRSESSSLAANHRMKSLQLIAVVQQNVHDVLLEKQLVLLMMIHLLQHRKS